MRGKGLFLTISHLLYDAALADVFVSIDEMSDFLDQPRNDVTSTIQVLHNIMVAVTEKEYLEELKKLLIRLGKPRSEVGRKRIRSAPARDANDRYTLNPMVSSLIEKGIGSTPVFEALRIVISELLDQWESAADKGKLTEFTGRLSKDHREGMVTEITRRYVLSETCELTEEEKERLRESPLTVDKFKKLCAARFFKAFELGRKLRVNITPSDVIACMSRQLKREEFPGEG
jgi:hypothetical protein